MRFFQQPLDPQTRRAGCTPTINLAEGERKTLQVTATISAAVALPSSLTDRLGITPPPPSQAYGPLNVLNPCENDPAASGGEPIDQTVGGSLAYTITATVADDPPTTIVNVADATPSAAVTCMPQGTPSPCPAQATVTSTAPAETEPVPLNSLWALALLAWALLGAARRHPLARRR